MISARSFSVVVAVLLSTQAASASDWPRFRGPDGAATSRETGLPLKWSASSRSVLWKTAMPGYGASSPIHVRDRIFITAYSGYGLDSGNPGSQDDLRLHLACIDPASGKVLWDRSVPARLPEQEYEQWLPEHFQSIPLTDLLGLYSPHDAMHLIGATSAEIQINVGHPLFLKYRADGADRRNSLRAEILHALPPPDADGQRPSVIAVQLRAYPDRGSLPQTVQMRYVLDGQGGPPSLLTSSAGRRNTWNLEQVDVGQEGAIQVWLASSLDLSRSSRLELLLAVPERGVVYAIPVTIMPVLEGDALTVFKWLTWFFAACGVCLVLSHAWSSRRTVWSELDPISRWRTLIGKAAGRAATALSRVRDRFSAPPSPAPHGDDKPAAGGPT